LRVRVERQTETARILAERLAAHPAVVTVRYAGIGGLLSFDVRGNAQTVERSTRLIKNATSLGGTETTMESRHRWEGDRVPVNMLRLSVGLEDADELWADLERALA
jgi:cystathionine gamma-synthase